MESRLEKPPPQTRLPDSPFLPGGASRVAIKYEPPARGGEGGACSRHRPFCESLWFLGSDLCRGCSGPPGGGSWERLDLVNELCLSWEEQRRIRGGGRGGGKCYLLPVVEIYCPIFGVHGVMGKGGVGEERRN